MNEDRFKGKWHELKGKVKSEWGKLTDDDIDQVQGKEEQLAGKIQHQYGVSKDEAKKQINKFIDSL